MYVTVASICDLMLNRVVLLSEEDLGFFEFGISNNMKLHHDLCLLLYYFV